MWILKLKLESMYTRDAMVFNILLNPSIGPVQFKTQRWLAIVRYAHHKTFIFKTWSLYEMCFLYHSFSTVFTASQNFPEFPSSLSALCMQMLEKRGESKLLMAANRDHGEWRWNRVGTCVGTFWIQRWVWWQGQKGHQQTQHSVQALLCNYRLLVR